MYSLRVLCYLRVYYHIALGIVYDVGPTPPDLLETGHLFPALRKRTFA